MAGQCQAEREVAQLEQELAQQVEQPTKPLPTCPAHVCCYDGYQQQPTPPVAAGTPHFEHFTAAAQKRVRDQDSGLVVRHLLGPSFVVLVGDRFLRGRHV